MYYTVIINKRGIDKIKGIITSALVVVKIVHPFT